MSIERGKELSGDAFLKWVELYTLLDGKGIIAPESEDLLMIYCDAYATWREAVTRIEGSGKLTKSPKDGIVVSPWITIKLQAAETMDRIGRQLGLSPDHPVLPKAPTWDEFAESIYGPFGNTQQLASDDDIELIDDLPRSKSDPDVIDLEPLDGDEQPDPGPAP